MRTNTVLDALKELGAEASKKRRPFREVVDRFLNGQIVLTRYVRFFTYAYQNLINCDWFYSNTVSTGFSYPVGVVFL